MAEGRVTTPKHECENCWAAEVNADFAGAAAAEAWARVAELLAIVEDERLTKAIRLYINLKKHQEHVVSCQAGSCEDEFKSLLAAGLVSSLVAKRVREKAAAHPDA